MPFNIDPKETTILRGGDELFLDGDTRIRTLAAFHPRKQYEGSMIYRIDEGKDSSLVYATDFEIDHLADGSINPDAGPFITQLEYLLRDADIMLCDGQYTQEEYPKHHGWGHPYMEQMVKIAGRAGVRHLIFTHHDPERSDETTDILGEKMRVLGSPYGMKITMGRQPEKVEGKVTHLSDQSQFKVE